MNHAEQQQRSANAVGGKTARACDSCIKRRARWYCAADDAFLCQSCDSSVHSANPLARRHGRVRLKTASFTFSALKLDESAPAWHQGFKRKARTPRSHHHGKPAAAPRSEPVVPDLETSGDDNNAEEEQLLYRVPIFDPVLAEFCSPPALDETNLLIDEAKPAAQLPDYAYSSAAVADGLAGFHPSDVDLAEFAADVESLLGHGLADDSFCMEGLGLVDRRDGDVGCCLADNGRVKAELDGDVAGGSTGSAAYPLDIEMELSRETLDINFDYGEEDEVPKAEEAMLAPDGYGVSEVAGATRFSLRLDYEAVIAAWSSRGCSPWTDGERPQLPLEDCWPGYTGMWGGGGEVQAVYGEVGMAVGGSGDGGREARVTRYREKRRTRLFSKKIRYEVRKLNAEKRPRMKGRFVKRASCGFPPPTAPGFHY